MPVSPGIPSTLAKDIQAIQERKLGYAQLRAQKRIARQKMLMDALQLGVEGTFGKQGLGGFAQGEFERRDKAQQQEAEMQLKKQQLEQQLLIAGVKAKRTAAKEDALAEKEAKKAEKDRVKELSTNPTVMANVAEVNPQILAAQQGEQISPERGLDISKATQGGINKTGFQKTYPTFAKTRVPVREDSAVSSAMQLGSFGLLGPANEANPFSGKALAEGSESEVMDKLRLLTHGKTPAEQEELKLEFVTRILDYARNKPGAPVGSPDLTELTGKLGIPEPEIPPPTLAPSGGITNPNFNVPEFGNILRQEGHQEAQAKRLEREGLRKELLTAFGGTPEEFPFAGPQMPSQPTLPVAPAIPPPSGPPIPESGIMAALQKGLHPLQGLESGVSGLQSSLRNHLLDALFNSILSREKPVAQIQAPGAGGTPMKRITRR